MPMKAGKAREAQGDAGAHATKPVEGTCNSCHAPAAKCLLYRATEAACPRAGARLRNAMAVSSTGATGSSQTSSQIRAVGALGLSLICTPVLGHFPGVH